MPDGVSPAVVVSELTMGTNGAEDAIAGDAGAIGLLDEAIESGAKIAAAEFVETGCVSMTVNGHAGWQVVLIENIMRTDPVKESVLNLETMRRAADGAIARVTLGIDGSGNAGTVELGISVGSHSDT